MPYIEKNTNCYKAQFLICDEIMNHEGIVKQLIQDFNEEVVTDVVSKNCFFDSLFRSEFDLACVFLKDCKFCYEEYLCLTKNVYSSEHIAFSFFGQSDYYFDVAAEEFDSEMLMIDVSLLRLVWSNKESEIKGLSVRDAVYKMIIESNQYGLQAYVNKYIGKNKSACESNGKILFWLDGIPVFPNGTSIHALGMLEGLYSQREFLPQIDICIDRKTAEHYDLKNKYAFSIVEKDNLSDVYEVVFLAVFICSLEVLDTIDKHSNKWCAWILDAIDLRCFNNNYQLNRTKFFSRFADGLVFTSSDAYQDFSSFVIGLNDTREQETAIISIPATIDNIDVVDVSDDDTKRYIPMSNYILIVGNRYKHKMIEETISAVSKISDNFVVLGASESGFIRDNVYGLVSGSLSDEELLQVYLNSAMVMFPSIYEGFGLPIVDAINCGKCVIVVDRQLNHEVEKLGEFRDRIYYYKSYNEIDDIIKEIRLKGDLDKNIYTRTWEDVGEELRKLLNRVFEKKPDIDRIANRHSYFDLYDKNEASRNKALQIIASIDGDAIKCDRIVDIYGKGKNSLLFAKKIRKKCSIGTIIDRNSSGINNVDGFRLISPNEYCYDESHIVVVIPEHFYSEIKEELIARDARFEGNVVNLEEFLNKSHKIL